MATSSRNRGRKAAYAAMADKSSRNQEAIEQVVCPLCAAAATHVQCSRCGGIGTVPASSLKGEAPSPITGTERVKAPKRATEARKLRRQEAAWGRCTGHEFGDPNRPQLRSANCWHCGCPASVVTAEG